MKYTLLMPLAGPMQSWGSRSRFDDRDTGLEPTRSGVVGLLCAALGLPRESDLSRFDGLRMGVRVDAPGRVMTDYHTAQNVLKADGSGTTNVQSYRHYLADARFLVGLETEDFGLLQVIEAKLRRPVWPLFLGRKSFPLTLPPYLPTPSSIRERTPLIDALSAEPWLRLHPGEKAPRKDGPGLRLVIEDDAGPMTLADRPLDFAGRRFGLRRVRNESLSGENLPPVEDHPCICRF